jgi:hypothetical protein
VTPSSNITGALLQATEAFCLAVIVRVGWEVGGKLWGLL